MNGTEQTPIEGVSMVYTFANAKATSRHYVQYFEIMGNRAIYPMGGWPVPCTGHRGSRSHAQRSSKTSGSSTTRVTILVW